MSWEAMASARCAWRRGRDCSEVEVAAATWQGGGYVNVRGFYALAVRRNEVEYGLVEVEVDVAQREVLSSSVDACPNSGGGLLEASRVAPHPELCTK